MSIFYLETQDGVIYRLDCTKSFSFSEMGSITEYKVESGATQSDHYVSENPELSLSGMITDLKISSSVSSMSTDEFISGLRSYKQSSKPLKVFYRDDVSKLERFFDNVYITDLSFDHGDGAGYTTGLYAYNVNIKLKQLTFSNRATVSFQNVPKIKDATAAKKTSSATTLTPPKLLTPLPEGTYHTQGKVNNISTKAGYERMTEQLQIQRGH